MFNIKKIIIVVIVVALAFGAYAYLFLGGASENTSGVTKQAVTTASGQSSTAGLDGPGKEFVVQLLAIQNIKFNLQLFADPVFIGLRDWSRELIPQEVGRPNPFAPLRGDISAQGSLNTFNGDIGSGSADSDKPALGGTTGTSTVKKGTTTTVSPKTKTVPVR